MRRLTKTKIYLDGGDPRETAAANKLLQDNGYAALDGQITNPSLIAANPTIAAQIRRRNILTTSQLLDKYQDIIKKIDLEAPGDISVEVYADTNTTAKELIVQARQFQHWSSSVVIKLPLTTAGLTASETLCREMRLNLTLCFTQAQAAAVYHATRYSRFQVYLSPFIGRLEDRGLNGLDLVANIKKMYQRSDHHVHIITASIRSVDHILGALAVPSDVLTIPFQPAFRPWAQLNFPLPDADYRYGFDGIAITYHEYNLAEDWHSLDITHQLTDQGLKKFSTDWNNLLSLEHVKQSAN